MRNTFGKDFRMCRSKDFQVVFREGRTFRESYCKVYVYPNARKCSRLGVIIAKKTIAFSTHRHQFKRIVRESFRLSSERLSGYDMVVMLRRHPKSKEELFWVLKSIWQKMSDWRSTL